MKKAYIFIHGNLSTVPSIKEHIQQQDIIICADGAAEFALKQGINPHIIIGDLDSITSEVKSYFQQTDTEWKQFPKEKDFTDAELAIRYALDQKVDELIILGLLGDRIDHMLSNIFHIAEVTKEVPCKMIEGNTQMYIVRNNIKLHGKKGDEISLIPLKGNCGRISTHGLYYPLQQENLPFGSTRGISNVFMDREVEVKVTDGTLLVVHRRI